MNDELVTQVEELGLSQKEARVYVASLMIGPSPVQKIADQAGIKRVTTYVILESLVNLGLVSQATKGKKTQFIAEDPVNLKRLLEKKQQALQEQKAGFEAILPNLKALKSLPPESPSMKFYDSAEGIRSIVSSFFASHSGEIKEVYGISNLDQLHAFFPEIEDAQANPERLKHGIKSKIIYTSKRGAFMKRSDAEMGRESRFVPADKFPINGDINISHDYIIMLNLSGSKPIGVVIQSQELAKGLMAIFELAWQAAERYNQE